MDEVRIPESAVGRAGMVAMLQRVRPDAVGRLVALRHPVGMMSTLGNSPRSVFAWQALILGEPIAVDGRPQPEIVVADRCLVPVSMLTSKQVERLRKAQAMRDFEEAMADLKRVLNGRELSSQMLDRALTRAAEFSAIRMALQEVPVATALREIGFRQINEGSNVWQWSGMHHGTELAVTAGPVPFDQWQIAGKCVTADKCMWDERVLPAQAPRGAIVLAILRLWRTAFGEAVPPGFLDFGALYERHRRDIDRMKLGRPTLIVDGNSLRATRRLISQRYWPDAHEVGPPPNLILTLTHCDGLLRFELSDEAYGCPAHGVWFGDCRLSLWQFLAVPYWRLRGGRVNLEQTLDSVRIGSHHIPTCFAD